MKANELRIGNWVQAPGGSYEQVYSVMTGEEFNPSWGPDGIYEDFKYTDITGISLTPEILAKAGFTQVPNYQEGVLGLNGIRMILHRGEWQWNDFTRNKGVPYLHHLQNLYFALTGEELKIEL